MRPSTISAFALGICAAVVAIVVGWTLSGHGEQYLPACETSIKYVVAP